MLSVSESENKCLASTSVRAQCDCSHGRIQSSAENYPDHGCLHSRQFPQAENSDQGEGCGGGGDRREMHQHAHRGLLSPLPALLSGQGSSTLTSSQLSSLLTEGGGDDVDAEQNTDRLPHLGQPRA